MFNTASSPPFANRRARGMSWTLAESAVASRNPRGTSFGLAEPSRNPRGLAEDAA